MYMVKKGGEGEGGKRSRRYGEEEKM